MSFRFEKFKIALRRGAMPGFLFRWRARLNRVPDAHLYNPTFQPWRGLPRFQSCYDEIKHRTLITPESAWMLYSLARQALGSSGAFLEAGVYRGGTARLLRRVIEESGGLRRLYLFDTFAGMPAPAAMSICTNRAILRIRALRRWPDSWAAKTGLSTAKA